MGTVRHRCVHRCDGHGLGGTPAPHHRRIGLSVVGPSPRRRSGSRLCLTNEPIARSHIGVGSAFQRVTHPRPRQEHSAWSQNQRSHDPHVGVERGHGDRLVHTERVHRPAALEEHAVSRYEPADIARPTHAFAASKRRLDSPIAAPGPPEGRSLHGCDASDTHRHCMPTRAEWPVRAWVGSRRHARPGSRSPRRRSPAAPRRAS